MFVSLSLLWACAPKGNTIGQNTPPQQIKKASSPMLIASMMKMAYHVDVLNRALKIEPEQVQFKKSEVVSRLTAIEQTASTLQTQNIQHPLFQSYLQIFLNNVKTAKTQASAEYPDFTSAKKVAQSCQNCHQQKTYEEPHHQILDREW